MQTSLIQSALRRTVFLALVAAPVLGAQERSLFTWNGRVDDDLHIVVQRGSISSKVVSGNQLRGGHVKQVSTLPRREGILRIERLAGRGNVSVVQQPNAGNDYTAIIDVKDADSGPDMYRFAAYFTPSQTTGGEVIGNGGMLNSGDVVLHWIGNVDRDIAITIRGGRVRQQTMAGAPSKSVQSTLVSTGLPMQEHQLTLVQREGRGTVTVTQQPTAANHYTAVIRVRDAKRGFGYYDFDIVWQ